MAIQQTLKKIDGTIYKTTLEHKKETRQHLEKLGLVNTAREVKCSVAGYVQALRDCGVITESDRQKLFIYYGTI